MPLKDPEKMRAYRKARRAIDREREAMRYATDPAFRARKIASAKKYYMENFSIAFNPAVLIISKHRKLICSYQYTHRGT